MSCLRVRSAHLALRKRGCAARIVTIYVPARWSKSTLLAYAREAHKPLGETVKIVAWGVSTDSFIPNPAAFASYPTGARFEIARQK